MPVRKEEMPTVCKQKKKIWLNNKIKQIEEAHKQNNAKKFFKDEYGKLISEQERILDIWEQYFRTLMKTGKKFEGNKGKEILQVDENILPPPTYIEYNNIIINLKLKEAPGTDNIPSELCVIKHGGSTLKERLYNLILLIWNKGELPKDWTEGTICPIHKKGDSTECSNYWPITFLNMAHKIFAILLNNRLSETVQEN
jgi:hypothetical protein